MVQSLQKKAIPFGYQKPSFEGANVPFNVLELEQPVEPLPTGEVEKKKETPTEDFSEKDCQFLCQSALQLPAVVWGSHLIRTNEQIQPFAHAFYNYCIRKGINPYDYFFDELPLVIAGIGLIKGMRDDHLKYKEGKKTKQ